MRSFFETFQAHLRALAVAAVMVVGLAGCSSPFAPSLPDIMPLPGGLLTADQQKKAVEELTAQKERQIDEAEKEIKEIKGSQ